MSSYLETVRKNHGYGLLLLQHRNELTAGTEYFLEVK